MGRRKKRNHVRSRRFVAVTGLSITGDRRRHINLRNSPLTAHRTLLGCGRTSRPRLSRPFFFSLSLSPSHPCCSLRRMIYLEGLWMFDVCGKRPANWEFFYIVCVQNTDFLSFWKFVEQIDPLRRKFIRLIFWYILLRLYIAQELTTIFILNTIYYLRGTVCPHNSVVQ